MLNKIELGDDRVLRERGANEKFKVGDKVKITAKSDYYGNEAKYNNVYPMLMGNFNTGDVHVIKDKVEKLVGKGYLLEGDTNEWVWTDGMLELVEEKTEKVEEKVRKYNVGDKVVVRKDLEADVQYYSEDKKGYDFANDKMVELAGETVTITEFWGKRGYTVEGSRASWIDGMFEGLAPEEVVVEKKKPETVDLTGHGAKLVDIQLQRVIYSDPATILFYNFSDDPAGKVRKIIAHCLPTDTYDKAKGLDVAILKAYRKLIDKQFKKL